MRPLSFLLGTSITFIWISFCSGLISIDVPPVVSLSSGKNISVQCRSSDFYIIWFHLNVPEDLISNWEEKYDSIEDLVRNIRPKDLNIENHGHIEYDDQYYNETTDIQIATLEVMEATDNDFGIYMCTKEMSLGKVKKILRKKKPLDFSAFLLTGTHLKMNSPNIEVDPGIEVPSSSSQYPNVLLEVGGNTSFTCRGASPVGWVTFNNQSYSVTESQEGILFIATLEVSQVTFDSVGFYVCVFLNDQNSPFNMYYPEKYPATSPVYLFVNDTTQLLYIDKNLPPPNQISAEVNTELIIPCKPTFPGVNITITGANLKKSRQNIQTGLVIRSNESHSYKHVQCTATYESTKQSVDFLVTFYRSNLEKPHLTPTLYWQQSLDSGMIPAYNVVEGEIFSYNCSVKNHGESLFWFPSKPAKSGKIPLVDSVDNLPTHSQASFNIVNVDIMDSGVYGCYTNNLHVNSSITQFRMNVLDKHTQLVEMHPQKANISLGYVELQESVQWIVFFRAYPSLYMRWMHDGKLLLSITANHLSSRKKSLISEDKRHEVSIDWRAGKMRLKLWEPTLRDVGQHDLVSSDSPNSYFKENTRLIFSMDGPTQDVVLDFQEKESLKREGSSFTIFCSAYGNPIPNITLLFQSCSTKEECTGKPSSTITFPKNSELLVKSQMGEYASAYTELEWAGTALVQGKYSCLAENIYGKEYSFPKILSITDSDVLFPSPIQIEVTKEHSSTREANGFLSVIEGDHLIIVCRGNTWHVEQSLKWKIKHESSIAEIPLCDSRTRLCVNELDTLYSKVRELNFKADQLQDSKTLMCVSDNKVSSSLLLQVEKAVPPTWNSETPALGGRSITHPERESLTLFCDIYGVPEPDIEWYKDDLPFEIDDKNNQISMSPRNITFNFLFSQDSGTYTCRASNRIGVFEDSISLQVEVTHNMRVLIGVIVVIAAFLLLSIIVLILKCYKERKRCLKIRLREQELFEQGNPDSINPNLDLSEQADLLPYNKKFEVPRDRITLENLLGSGAFGNVFKASVSRLISGESKTTVAVKMLKSQANDSHMKSLRTEIKIMANIGRHINIVNLLGACSKDMATKGELLMIVEYCRHGNILEYMRRHRSEFINQINHHDKIDTRTRPTSRTMSVRNGIGRNYTLLDMHSDSTYSGNACQSTLTLQTDDCSVSYRPQTSRNRTLSNETRLDRQRLSSLNSYTSDSDVFTDNYLSNASFEPRSNLCTKDLLHWSYQIANGMFYLSERKVIHGDLAARNILLADHKVVKISDFGLAKNLYADRQYQKKSAAPVPVKWVALEALRDGIYSTQSDVWSFGIVLWEIFSLGQIPYAGIEFDQTFIKNLESGVRLKPPPYSTKELNDVMYNCWHTDPNARLVFRDLEKRLGEMLGETERQVYLTLNAENEETTANEILMTLKTPSYDSRVKEFFGDDIAEGYETPLASPSPGVLTCIDGVPTHFKLGPVPKRNGASNSDLPEETDSLLRKEHTTHISCRFSVAETSDETSQAYLPMFPANNHVNINTTLPAPREYSNVQPSSFRPGQPAIHLSSYQNIPTSDFNSIHERPFVLTQLTNPQYLLPMSEDEVFGVTGDKMVDTQKDPSRPRTRSEASSGYCSTDSIDRGRTSTLPISIPSIQEESSR